MLYSNPTFAAIAPAHQAAKAFSYHDSGQPWGEGPHPLSPEMQASYGPLPWSGEGCTCLQCLGPVLSLCPLFPSPLLLLRLLLEKQPYNFHTEEGWPCDKALKC
jgi:hypothetical protein